MFDTYKMMARNNNKEFDCLSVNETVRYFQIETNKRERSRIYSNVFCRMYPLMYKMSHKFSTLPYEDKIEICMQVLLDAMNKYNNDKIKFFTFFYRSLVNRLLTYKNRQNTAKQKVNTLSHSDTDLVRNVLSNKVSSPYVEESRRALNQIIESKILSTKEKEYCACLMAGFSIKETNQKVNPCHNIKSKIKSKLKIVLN